MMSTKRFTFNRALASLAALALFIAIMSGCVLSSEESDSDVEYDTSVRGIGSAASRVAAARRRSVASRRSQKQKRTGHNHAVGSNEGSSDDAEEWDEVAPDERSPNVMDDGIDVDETSKPKRKMKRRYEVQETFAIEAVFVMWIAAMAVRYFQGKTANIELTKRWMQDHMDLLFDNFSVVGDDGSKDDGEGEEGGDGDGKKDKELKSQNGPKLIRDNSSNFTMYCTGRSNCRSCTVTFELLSRQDLVSTVVNAFTKAKDEVTLTFELDEADMPNPFALAVVPVRGHKEYKEENADLRDFTATLKAGHKGLPKSLIMMCDAEPIASEVVDVAARELIAENASLFHSIHISDETSFEGVRCRRVARFRFFVPNPGASKDERAAAVNLSKMALAIVDKISTVRFSAADIKTTKKMRAAREQKRRQEAQQELDEKVAARKLQSKKKQEEEFQKFLDTLSPEQRRKAEVKRAEQERKKKQKKGSKKKMSFVSM